MNTSHDIFSLLQAVTVSSSDNGVQFTRTHRVEVIEKLLKDTPYKLISRQPLALLYAKRELRPGDSVVLISSHIDSLYGKCFCHDEGECLRGTFDNSFGNASVLSCMLAGTLPDNVVVAFTGDEEKGSQGAIQALLAVGNAGGFISLALVQDVTNEGWDSSALFTIENDFRIDMLTAHKIISLAETYKERYLFVHDSLADETWTYAEYGIPCFALCVPVGGDLHSDDGVLLRKDAAVEYCKVLALLAGVVG